MHTFPSFYSKKFSPTSSIFDYCNAILIFKSKILKEKYKEYKLSRSKPSTIFPALTILIILFISYFIIDLIFHNDYFCLVLAPTSILLLLTFYVLVIKARLETPIIKNEKDFNFISHLENATFIIMEVILGLTFISIIIEKEYCHEDTLSSNFHCTSDNRTGSVPPDISFVLSMFPLFASNIFVSVSWEIVNISYFLSAVFLLVGILYKSAWNSILFVLISLIVSISVSYLNRAHSLGLFLLTHFQSIELEADMAEKQNLIEFKNQELRSMIANVAHDIKSPLSSFFSGVDNLANILHEMESLTKDKLNHLDKKMASEFNQVKSSLKSLACSQNFMLMTVNRSIDFARSNQNLPLVPRMNKLSIDNLILTSLSCIRILQNEIKVETSNLVPSEKREVITDIHWIQDNILCLLSNAIKYSISNCICFDIKLTKTNCPYPPSNKRAESSVTHDDYILFEVINHGDAPKTMSNKFLFEPGPQSKRTTGGTGLGLYCLAKRIEALGGCYGVDIRKLGENQSNSTWNFWFTIPRVERLNLDKYVKAELPLFSELSFLKELKNPYNESISGSEDETISLVKPRDSLTNSFSLEKEVSLKNTIFSFQKHLNGIIMETKQIPESQDSTVSANPAPNKAQPKEYINIEQSKSTENVQNISMLENLRVTLPNLNILVVDDSLAIVKMLRLTLSRHAHRVSTAKNGLEALNQFIQAYASPEDRFDVILMDIQMPVMDGIEATKKIRENETNFQLEHPNRSKIETQDSEMVTNYSSSRKVLIVGMSANSDNETEDGAYDAGVDFFIPKPFNYQDFSIVVSKYI